MPELKRITSEYIEGEDRVCLTGEVGEGETETLWLTHRLLTRLIGHLLKWLEQQVPAAAPDVFKDEQAADMMQGFAQQAANAELSAQQPVQSQADTQSWLVTSVDVTSNDQLLTLTFKGANGESTLLNLQAQPLRQWLAIIHQLWQATEWPQTTWPQWMSEAGGQAIASESDNAFH
jgi:hypothetical protein